MMRIIAYISLGFFASFYTTPCLAQQTWEFKRTYESKNLINSPFFLNTSADIDGNGTKELIVTDFGHFGDHIEEWKQWVPMPTRYYNLFILEWQDKDLKVKMHKQWDMNKPQTRDERDEYFRAYEARQMVFWQVGNRVLVETIPPYLGLEWQGGNYVLTEQQGWAQKKPLVGSWVFPWISPSCYFGFPDKRVWPQECLVGIRDFSGKGDPKILTVMEDRISYNQFKQTLRIRKFRTGFPIEWEKPSPVKFYWWSTGWEPGQNDRLNKDAIYGLLMHTQTTKYYFAYEKNNKEYSWLPIKSFGQYANAFDLPEIYLRETQKKGMKEYWSYRRVELNDPESLNFIVVLRKATLKPDYSGFVSEDIDFPHHDHFLGVGYFAVEDIDGDGLDEIILVEQTAGKLTSGEETVHYGDIKDYIHVLKWDGSKYKDMWVSPPYSKRGTKFLVEDIKNTGKKQLVVLSPYGTVQIWERQ